MTATDATLREAVAGFTAAQQSKALALIAAGRLHPVDGLPGVFVAIGSDKVTRYMVDEHACGCPRGAAGCYHLCAVRLVLAAASMRKAA